MFCYIFTNLIMSNMLFQLFFIYFDVIADKPFNQCPRVNHNLAVQYGENVCC